MRAGLQVIKKISKDHTEKLIYLHKTNRSGVFTYFFYHEGTDAIQSLRFNPLFYQADSVSSTGPNR